jgi:hypothetical protein
MKIISSFLIAMVFGFGVIPVEVWAEEAPASEASVRELIEITQAKKMMDRMMVQTTAMLKAQIRQSLPENQYSPEQQEILNQLQDKITAAVMEDMRWDSVEPMFIDIYRKSFSQSDMDEMIAFYRSKAGQHMISRMPLVMQNTMQAMQVRMAQLMPKLEKIQNDAIAQLKAAKKTH